MTTDELLQLAAEKAAREVSDESLEFLFRPSSLLELLLRLDLTGTKQLLHESLHTGTIGRVTMRDLAWCDRCVELETLYRQIKVIKHPELRDKLLPFLEVGAGI